MSFEEFEGFGDTGHGFGWAFNNVNEFFEGTLLIGNELFTVMINFFF